jgi:hypothetical protein
MARPTKYKEEYPKQAYKLCLIGATDAQLANFFEVNPDTIYEWKKVHEEFSESLKRGKQIADGEVAKSLFHRAKGYSHKAVHISNYQGEITQTDIIKEYPPDTTACIFWLKNRQSEMWRDKREYAVNEDNREIEDFNIDELQQLLKDSLSEEAIEARKKKQANGINAH